MQSTDLPRARLASPLGSNVPLVASPLLAQTGYCGIITPVTTDDDNALSGGRRDAILDAIEDGVFTVSTDWRITYLNSAAEKITGVPREEALGRRCSEVLRANVCESACPLRETIATGKPVVNLTVYIVNALGKRVPISVSTGLLRDEKGHIIGGVETFRDLSVVEDLRKELAGRFSLGDIVSRSRAMASIFKILPDVAASTSTVLILGESGTGKELLARAVHDLGPRSSRPFIALSCGALPDTLLESELFGYVAGAFTDARGDKPGRFAAADGGTIFLDEIGDISPALQVRLLRVLQERTYEPLGSNEPVKANVRVIAATNRDLGRLVAEGAFRQDLYYRINVVSLTLPPLRERKEDIPLLVERFVDRFNHIQGRGVAGVSDSALALLMGYDFPGNIRELENIIERAFVLCGSGPVEPVHLPEEIAGGGKSALQLAGGTTTLKEMERLFIEDALRKNSWNRAAAARQLGIHKSTLFRKIKAYDLQIPPKDTLSGGK
ncbi:MAG: sigma 54-interacting transcriptional regulator [Planctomycetes bacterium]|nr:sigma 54-interacting transcriptional regulator [Planctomycetota bacterium]